MKHTFTRDEQDSLKHALIHLKANRLGDGVWTGWYRGNKAQFIKRHVKAIAFVQSLLAQNALENKE